MEIGTNEDKTKYFVFVNNIRSHFNQMSTGPRVILRDALDLHCPTHFHMNVVRLEDQEIVGEFIFRQDMLNRIRLEPEIFPQYQRNGYAKEATGLCFDFAELVLGRSIKYAGVMPDDEAAKALFKAFGFKEGSLVTFDADIERSPDFPPEEKLNSNMNGIVYLSMTR